MKYHSLFFLKIKKDVANLSSAAVVIGDLRVKHMQLAPEVIKLLCSTSGGFRGCALGASAPSAESMVEKS